MKQSATILNIFLAFALLLILVFFGLPSLRVNAAPAVQTTPEPAEDELLCETGRTIQVSGTAVVNVTPDRVLIQLGVQSNGSTPQRVEATNSATINKIIRVLKIPGHCGKRYRYGLVCD